MTFLLQKLSLCAVSKEENNLTVRLHCPGYPRLITGKNEGKNHFCIHNNNTSTPLKHLLPVQTFTGRLGAGAPHATGTDRANDRGRWQSIPPCSATATSG